MQRMFMGNVVFSKDRVCVASVVLFFFALCVGCVNGTNDVASVWAPCCAVVVACPMPEVLWRVLCLFVLMRQSLSQ